MFCKRRKTYLIIGMMSVGLLVGACGCTSANLGILGFFMNNPESSAQAGPESSAQALEEGSSEVSSSSAAASSRAQESSSAIDNTEKNHESYRELKEKWDEASRKQQSRVDEIMGRNSSSAAAGGNSGNNGGSASLKVPVSGTWYGPKNPHTGDQSVVTLYNNGNAKVTFDLGAAETVTFNGTYTSYKNGTYEYDDIVCTVTLSGNYKSYNFPSNKFTFIIDPEVENGMYARFVESGFGQIQGNATFTK